MHWTSCLSIAPDANAAVDEVVNAVSSQLGATPDLVFVFASHHHLQALPWLPGRISKELGHAPLVGSTGSGILGAGREIEGGPALAVAAAHLPEVAVNPFFLEPTEVPPPGTASSVWDARLGLTGAAPPSFIVMPDPYTCRASDFVQALDGAYPDSSVIGGLASGGSAPGENRLLCGNESHDGGVVGVALSGNIEVDTVVAQGCRPVGAPMFVTRGGGNVIAELDGRAPGRVLQELYNQLGGAQQTQLREGLHLGFVMSQAQEVYSHGDFLVRNVLGLDARTGALGVAASVSTGQVVQFHLRDAKTSAEDLDALLGEHCSGTEAPAGALLFSCLGRGEKLYGAKDHDSNAFARHAPATPLAGFFCSGEIGPVAGRTHVHGYTSVFALFRRQRAN